jgi:hypothetical protein
MGKYVVKFAKGRPVVADVNGNRVSKAFVRVLNFPAGPVEVIEGRKWGPEHRPSTADIEIEGTRVQLVPVQNARRA